MYSSWNKSSRQEKKYGTYHGTPRKFPWVNSPTYIRWKALIFSPQRSRLLHLWKNCAWLNARLFFDGEYPIQLSVALPKCLVVFGQSSTPVAFFSVELLFCMVPIFTPCFFLEVSSGRKEWLFLMFSLEEAPIVPNVMECHGKKRRRRCGRVCGGCSCFFWGEGGGCRSAEVSLWNGRVPENCGGFRNTSGTKHHVGASR